MLHGLSSKAIHFSTLHLIRLVWLSQTIPDVAGPRLSQCSSGWLLTSRVLHLPFCTPRALLRLRRSVVRPTKPPLLRYGGGSVYVLVLIIKRGHSGCLLE